MQYELRFRLYQYSMGGVIQNRYHDLSILYDTLIEAESMRDTLKLWRDYHVQNQEATAFIRKYIHSGFVEAVHGIWPVKEKVDGI